MDSRFITECSYDLSVILYRWDSALDCDRSDAGCTCRFAASMGQGLGTGLSMRQRVSRV